MKPLIIPVLILTASITNMSTTAIGVAGEPSDVQVEEARRILREANKATHAVKYARYEAKVDRSDGPTTVYRIVSRKATESKPLGGEFVLWPKVQQEKPISGKMGFDGDVLWTLNSEAKTVNAWPLDAVRVLILVSLQDIWATFVQHNPLREAAMSETVKLQDGESVLGIPCHVVSVEYPATQITGRQHVRIYIGTQDYLPRRVVRRTIDPPERTTITTYQSLRTDVKVRDAEVKMRVPQGFTLDARAVVGREGRINIPRIMYSTQSGKLTTLYCLAALNPDQVPEFVLNNHASFRDTTALRQCCRKLAQISVELDRRKPHRKEIEEAASRLVGSDPDLLPHLKSIVDSQMAAIADLRALFNYISEITETIPSMLKGDSEPYRRTSIYRTTRLTQEIAKSQGIYYPPLKNRVVIFNIFYRIMQPIIRFGEG